MGSDTSDRLEDTFSSSLITSYRKSDKVPYLKQEKQSRAAVITLVHWGQLGRKGLRSLRRGRNVMLDNIPSDPLNCFLNLILWYFAQRNCS